MKNIWSDVYSKPGKRACCFFPLTKVLKNEKLFFLRTKSRDAAVKKNRYKRSRDK